MATEAIVSGNKTYPNAVVSSMIEDQYNTHLDALHFVTVSHDLEGTPGMKKVIRRYTATDTAEILAQGEGNSEYIAVDYTEDEVEIILIQDRFRYFDEEAMRDPKTVETGTGKIAVNLFNKTDALVMAEFGKTTNTVQAPNGKWDFDAFVDAVAAFPALAQEGQDRPEVFGFIHKEDLAELRKNLKEPLSQVEAYVRTGYVGTVNGVNLYCKANATKGEIVVATKAAVHFEVKTGTQTEYKREPNVRSNEIYGRKYGLPYLADEKYCIKLTKAAG